VAAKAAKEYNLWRNVYSDELSQMAIKDETLSTICLVHVVDHLENLEATVQELARILKRGGKLYFSGFSDKHYKASLLHLILRVMVPRATTKYANFLSGKRHHYNMFSKGQWMEIFSRYGMHLEEYHYSQTGGFAFIAYFLHFVCFHNHCFDFQFYKRCFLGLIFERLFYFYYISWYPAFLKTKKGGLKWGDDFFAVARKL